MFSLINKWSSLAFKKYNKEMLRILCYPYLSAQSHCVILGLHQIFNMSSHSKAHCASMWGWGTAMGSCAFPCIYTWLLLCCTDEILLTNCSLQETGVLEHVSFVASLRSFSAHMGGSLLRTQQQFAALFFFFCSSFLFFWHCKIPLCVDIHGVFNRALPKRENVY